MFIISVINFWPFHLQLSALRLVKAESNPLRATDCRLCRFCKHLGVQMLGCQLQCERWIIITTPAFLMTYILMGCKNLGTPKKTKQDSLTQLFNLWLLPCLSVLMWFTSKSINKLRFRKSVFMHIIYHRRHLLRLVEEIISQCFPLQLPARHNCRQNYNNTKP